MIKYLFVKLLQPSLELLMLLYFLAILLFQLIKSSCDYGGYPYACCIPPPPPFPKRKAALAKRLEQYGAKHPSAHLVEHANRMTRDLVNVLPNCAALMCNSYGFGVDGRAFSERLHVLSDHYKNYREDAAEFINTMEQPPTDKITHPQPLFHTDNNNGYQNMRRDVDYQINDFTPIPSFKWTWPTTNFPPEDQMKLADIGNQPKPINRRVFYKHGERPHKHQEKMNNKREDKKTKPKSSSKTKQ
ncbi:unnamed protein product [Allacma fusca]|uniref:Uncharacterized protein n=1 Tax=Allacma fusca TaxID=39272 RepID=A0A8J2LT43_9HEXA|nr:unnamed protein product [Allacma fusca]